MEIKTKEEDKKKIMENYENILKMDKSYLNDAEMVLLAIKNTKIRRWSEENSDHSGIIEGRSVIVLEHVSERLKKDKSVIEASIFYDFDSIKFINEELLEDKEYVKRLLMINPEILLVSSNSFKTDRLLNAIENDVLFIKQLILKYCNEYERLSYELFRIIKEDKQLINQLIAVNPLMVLNFFPNDEEYIMEIIKNTRTRKFEEDECEIQRNEDRFIPLKYAGDSLKSNINVIKASIAKDPKAICYISKVLRVGKKENRVQMKSIENINPNIKYWFDSESFIFYDENGKPNDF